MIAPQTPGGAASDTGATAGAHGARVIAGAPDAPFVVPEPLMRRFGDDVDEVVWVNEAGGVTVRVVRHGRTAYAKWAPPGDELDLAAEVDRLRWAGVHAVVPDVIGFESDADGEILLTAAVPGSNAVSARWRAQPERAVKALGTGLRALHESLPVQVCPFSWSVDSRIARTRAQGIPERVAALNRLPAPPSVDRLVVCHGDACAPNTLLADDGSVAGHVDLGRLGVADRWADIAIGAWSTEWNYGPGYTGLYYESYGVEPDAERIAYYRALWDAT